MSPTSKKGPVRTRQSGATPPSRCDERTNNGASTYQDTRAEFIMPLLPLASRHGHTQSQNQKDVVRRAHANESNRGSRSSTVPTQTRGDGQPRLSKAAAALLRSLQKACRTTDHAAELLHNPIQIVLRFVAPLLMLHNPRGWPAPLRRNDTPCPIASASSYSPLPLVQSHPVLLMHGPKTRDPVTLPRPLVRLPRATRNHAPPQAPG